MRKRGIKMVIIWLLAISAFSAAVMLLWNALIPGIFGLATISFWQALGLLVLARLLFGGFGHGKMMMAGGMHGKNSMHDKWMKMTPEERKEFIKKRHEYMHGRPFRGHSDVTASDETTTHE